MEPSAAEGWYRDPYGSHEARWYSAGNPTALVRDGDVESRDPPPAGRADTPEPEELPWDGSDGHDLLRADAAEEPTVDEKAGWAHGADGNSAGGAGSPLRRRHRTLRRPHLD